jgi:hypothetical protein
VVTNSLIVLIEKDASLNNPEEVSVALTLKFLIKLFPVFGFGAKEYVPKIVPLDDPKYNPSGNVPEETA